MWDEISGEAGIFRLWRGEPGVINLRKASPPFEVIHVAERPGFEPGVPILSGQLLSRQLP